MFRTTISSILRSARLWYNAPTMLPAGHQQAVSSVHYSTSCKHSLALLRMGEIIARNMLSLTEIFNKIIIVVSGWLFILLYQYCTVIQTSNHFCCKFSWFRIRVLLLTAGSFCFENVYGALMQDTDRVKP